MAESLKMGRKVVIGFEVGFLIPGFIVGLTLISLQGMSGNETFFSVLASFTLSFAIGFGLAGAIGAASTGLGFKVICTGAAAFGVGGSVFWLPLLPMLKPGGTLGPLMVLAGLVVGVIIPFAVGGFLLARTVGKIETG